MMGWKELEKEVLETQRDIYLVQVDTLRKMPTHSTLYLPYAVGTLWAYAKQAPAVEANYALRELICMREPVEQVADRIKAPFLVGFSCYVWNTEYNKVLAGELKRRFPACHIVFGGHNVPSGSAMLDELPYVDFLLHNEGELGFQALLLELCKESPDVTAVPGLSYRTEQGVITNAIAVAQSVAAFPSPYLEGIFDPLIAAHPEIEWSTVWETNRGCPHHCIYCDWGQHKAKVRQFPMERLLAEIEWFSRNRIGFIYGADANFGIFARDEDLLDALADVHGRTGYPRLFDVNTTKTLNERVFRITEKLNRSGLDKTGPSLAMQSMSPEVLRIIGRQNIDENMFAQWIRRCRQAGYRTHTDLIMGLPGETLQSFCTGVEKLFVLGQHEGIRYFLCNLLPNALMAAPAMREKYKIRATRFIFKLTMEAAPEIINEYIESVDETSTMPFADMLTANYFIFLVHSMHSFGLLRLIAMFFHTEKIVSYADFYMGLLDFCHRRPDTLPGEAMARIETHFSDMARSREPELLEIPGFGFGNMSDDQYLISRAILELDRFYAGAEEFLRQFSAQPDVFAQLLRYQRESILLPRAEEKTLCFDYDFPAYFNAIYDGAPAPLQKKAVRLRFSFDDCDISDEQKYFHTIVQLGRFTSKAFYTIDYLPAEGVG
ncbi:MAG: radical SAM protein [Oscillospiraceae bacterium]|jgi:putative methyltransferase|nr:radical SAM protein [Oscillospiraceae bacterium]